MEAKGGTVEATATKCKVYRCKDTGVWKCRVCESAVCAYHSGQKETRGELKGTALCGKCWQKLYGGGC